MTLKVVFRPAARAEFDGATLWYEDREPGLGVQFVAEIDRAVDLASKHPDRYPIKHNAARSCNLESAPVTANVWAAARTAEGVLGVAAPSQVRVGSSG